MTITRRHFVRNISFAALAPPFLAAFKPTFPLNDSSTRLPISFSTLGCPAWEWQEILDFAAAHGFAAVELRGLQGNLDLPTHPVFAPARIEQTKTEIAAHGLHIACVSSSATMHEKDSAARAKNLSDGRRFIDLAAALGSPYIRVFCSDSNGPRQKPDSELRGRVASGLKELGEYAGPRNVTVLIESHDNFTSAEVLSDVLTRADSPHTGLLWDAHHTFADAGESPEYSVAQLGRWIHHTHLKDSVVIGATGADAATGTNLAKNSERHYVLTGRGTIPIQRQVAALKKMNYPGYFCFEWEKVWHPDLEDPEIAIADYARVIAGYLKNA
jgi:sugar phosphate isomerase/epimerase